MSSSLSLNRLCNGGGGGGSQSKNKMFNWKFGKSSTLPTPRRVIPKALSTIDINNNTNGDGPMPMTRRKHLLNRRGSLHHNQFKGVKKELMEKHANMIIHTMTVRSSAKNLIVANLCTFFAMTVSHLCFLIFLFSQIEELYEEILYEILHNVGSDESQLDHVSLFAFIQEAFKFSAETHEQLLEKASVKEAPELRLNIEVIEAKDLNPKDPNGLADPFVTLYIASAPNTRYTSSVKSATLSPKYEEHFSLYVE